MQVKYKFLSIANDYHSLFGKAASDIGRDVIPVISREIIILTVKLTGQSKMLQPAQ